MSSNINSNSNPSDKKNIPVEERHTLITGCSSGIGLAVAEGLKQRGYPIIVTARTPQDLERLRNQGFTAVHLDYDDSESIQRGLEETLKQTDGHLYALFNNGAYGQPGAVEDISRDTLRQQFETNLFGWHELTTKVLPIMRKQGYGRIIQNSSVLGFVSMKYRGAYNASKYALEGLCDTLRLELAGTQIFVSLVEPGPIESHFRKNALKKFKENIDPTQSAHRAHYEQVLGRLSSEESNAPFTLPAEAVTPKVLHALESRQPKVRYPVTFPTYLFAYLKRVLPAKTLDRLLGSIG